MKADLLKYMCTICKLSFGFDGMTYSSDGKRLLCKNCYNQAAKKNDKPALGESKAKTTASQLSPAAPDSTKVMCVDCKYKFFLRKGSRISQNCPYCGKNRLAKYDELTADNLINEVSRDKSSY